MDSRSNNNDFDYTVVLDPTYTGPDPSDFKQDEPEESVPAKTIVAEKSTLENSRAFVDQLYDEYQRMCMKDPNVLDADDAFPHTYQWRIVDKYDPAKVAVVRDALLNGKKIADTEAYEKFVEDVSSSHFKPESWD